MDVADGSYEFLDRYSRYRFQDHDFISQWKALQKFVKYRSIGDYVYAERHFSSARHLQESLDKVAIPALYSVFQNDESFSIGSEDHDLIELRKLVCKEMHDAGEFDDDSEFVREDPPATELSQETLEWNSPRPSFRANMRKTDNKRSAISYDAGTDQYLKKKKKSKQSTKESIENAFPSLESTMAHAKSLDTNDAETIEASYVNKEFSRWKFLLYSMHPLILYGNGSKRKVVKEFCDLELRKDGAILQIDAIDTDVTVDSIARLLSELFRCKISSKLSTVKNAEMIGKTIQKDCEESSDAVFLIIYNVECLLERHAKEWPAIATLSKYIRILATVDDVDAPSRMSSCTSFVWIALHTQRPYVRELAKLAFVEDGKKKKSTNLRRLDLSDSRILEVLRNLAPRYAEVMQVLARLQTKVQGDEEDIGGGWVNYKDFREECKNNFLIDKDSKLRSLQTELKDHGLMVDKLDATGEFVMIPYSASKLQAIQNLKVKLHR